MLNILAVGLGGFLGSILRYLIGLIKLNEPSAFPVKTLVVNVVGAFAIGVLAALAARSSSIDPKVMLFLKVGVCGGFTTFSTFALESVQLMQDGKPWAAALYIALSVVLSVAAVFLAESVIR